MNVKSLLIAGIVLASIAPVAADTIDDKVEYQGKPSNIEISGLRVKERGSLMALQIELTNTSRDNQTAYYRLKWLDESGFQVWDDEAWKPVLLHGKQKHNLQAVAPTTQARDFRIQFNEKDSSESAN